MLDQLPTFFDYGRHKLRVMASAHFDYKGPASQPVEVPQLPALTEHDPESLGLTDFSG